MTIKTYYNNIDYFFEEIKKGNKKTVKELIDSGIDINAKDKYGYTPLMIATENNKSEVVELLLKKGAELNVKNDDGETALMIAAYNNSIKAGKVLIKYGANFELKDSFGRTAYDIAHEMYKNANDYFLKEKLSIETRFALFCSTIFAKVDYGVCLDIFELIGQFHLQTGIMITKENAVMFLLRNSDDNNFNNYEIKKIGNDKIQKYPNKEKVLAFLREFFLNIKEGSSIERIEIENSFYKKYNCVLTEKNICNIKSDDFKISTKIPIIKLLNNYFENENDFYVFTFEEINTVFYYIYGIDINLIVFKEYIQNNKCNGYVIEQLPKDVYIKISSTQHTKGMIFTNTIPQMIEKSKLPFSVLKNMKILNKYLKNKGYIFRETTYNKNFYILTLDDDNKEDINLVIDNVSNFLKSFFSLKKIGYICLSKEIKEQINEYDIELNEMEFVKAIENTNKVLNSRKIIYDEKEKSLKYIKDINTNEIECPICNEPFSLEGIKEHVLYNHPHDNLTTDIKNGYFKCNKCKREFDIHIIKPTAFITHIKGECPEKWEKKFFKNEPKWL